MRLSGQTQNARKRKMNCLTHTPRNVKGNTIWQPDKRPIIHLLFLFLWFFFYYFVVSTMKLHALAGRSKKVVVTGEVGCASWKDCHPNLHASISVYFATHLSSRCMVPPDPHPNTTAPSGAQRCPGSRLLATATCLCVTPHSAAPFAQPWASFHFRLANHGDTIQWCDIYALSGWSLFTCQSIRVSCCGRSDSHEASASEWTHDRQS